MYKSCPHSRGIGEIKTEKWLLENIENEMDKYVQSVKIEELGKPKDVEKKRKALEGKLKRNKELYIEGEIDKEEFSNNKEEYIAQLAALPADEKKDTSEIEAFLNSDWRNLYANLEKHEKRAFWRSIVDYIEVDKDLNFIPHFFN